MFFWSGQRGSNLDLLVGNDALPLSYARLLIFIMLDVFLIQAISKVNIFALLIGDILNFIMSNITNSKNLKI